MLWIFSDIKFKNSVIYNASYATLNLFLADVIGCAYNNMNPLEWIERLKILINSHKDVIEYSEFNKVIRYIEESFESDPESLEFTKSEPSQQLKFDELNKIITEELSYTFYIERMLDFFDKQGLNFKNNVILELNGNNYTELQVNRGAI